MVWKGFAPVPAGLNPVALCRNKSIEHFGGERICSGWKRQSEKAAFLFLDVLTKHFLNVVDVPHIVYSCYLILNSISL